MKLRGALLGAGNIALRGHIPQWLGDERLRDEAEIVAIADLSPANLALARRSFPDVRVYERAEDLIETEALDFCDICTPPFTHRSVVEIAAARGVHVLCEKPLAPTVDEAVSIATAVRSARVVFEPCHQYHFSPQWSAVRSLLPRLGRILVAEYDVLRTEANPGNPNWQPAWRTDPGLAGGGILVDHGAHIFYQLVSVLGMPHSVNATVRTLRHHEYGVEDTAFVTLDFGSGLAAVRLTWAARHREVRFRFAGEHGELVGNDRRLVLLTDRGEEAVQFDDGISKDSAHSGWYSPLFRRFTQRVRVNDLAPEPMEEALVVTRLIARAYESSEAGRVLAV
ncbi:MAG TPA: Gfo/Idh/MocA family oxidoreductase [Candidatus Krumholzibacteria bacterium]|nr:Gfo/Idh/MocA family oxidoreductase [Candidatus Krumholzibacteria bacterium]